MKKRIINGFFLAAVIGLFSGCVMHQKVPLEYEAQKSGATAQNYPKVDVVVNDIRSYVQDGEKPPSYIGTYRGGFGNPFNVNTEGDVPLADLLKKDLMSELTSLGFTQEGGSKTLIVDIMDWKFDAFQNAKFNYMLRVRVADDSKSTLATSEVVGKDIYIEGTFMGGGKAGVERDMPKLYSDIIKKIVRDNSDILGALK